MPKKQRPSFQKRQKEMARQQKQKEKEARRAERKLQREAGVSANDDLHVLTAPQPLPEELAGGPAPEAPAAEE
ncbi:MAG TPA: hypothetical protein VN317_09915 [Candidatus Methanoperedens sp.]|nr:hypothetical protein [Candidatus Methanoperedens sp.]